MRFPVRYQLEASDCGPTCIQMIAAYYKKSIPLSLLKDYCHITRLGVSTRDMMDGCKKIGLEGAVLTLSIDKMKVMPLPAILFWRQNHFVVIYQIKKKKDKYYFYIVDPGFGRVRLNEQEVLKEWSNDEDNRGICILLEPTELFYTKQYDNKVLINIFSPKIYFRKYKRKLYYSLIFIAVTFLCSWFLPFILQNIIDKGINQNNMNFVLLMLIGQMCLVMGNMISTYIGNRIVFKVGLNISIDIAIDYLYKLVKLPIHFFDTRVGSDLLQRMNDEEKIKTFLTHNINVIALTFLNFVIYSSVLIYYSAYVFILFVFFSFLSALVTRYILRNRLLINYSLFSSYSKKTNTEYELVNGMIEVKINNSDSNFLKKWKELQIDINKLSIKNLYLEYYLNIGTSFLNVVRDIIITAACAYLVINKQMTFGAMMTISYLLGQLSGSVYQVVGFFKSFQDSKLSYERIGEIIKVENENKNRSIVFDSQHKFQKGYEFQNVYFKYEGSYSPFVLKDLTCSIPIGKVTAIVGASGSGKTTLLKLLLSFYYPQKGDVYLDDVKMSDINTENWHGKCGVVMQDGYIFSDTITKNIAISDETPDIKYLEEVAHVVRMDDFINTLPLKYNTKIGKSGIDMSGGQKQRILIARALYRKPDFLFFDEATSTLDSTNEKLIMENLKSYYVGRTVVIIAHRLSTVKDADNILVLDNGLLVEEGNHKQLVERKGVYFNLVKNQLELGI